MSITGDDDTLVEVNIAFFNAAYHFKLLKNLFKFAYEPFTTSLKERNFHHQNIFQTPPLLDETF